MKGFTDKPAIKLEDDSFGVERYISGLSSFILDCNTPMTIAIQGDWGSGKTSMMNMVREKLGDQVVPVWFNTWQYSQFNMSDDLSLSLLGNLVEALDIKDAKSDRIKQTLRIVASFAKRASIIAADTFIGGKVADELETAVNKASGSQENTNMAKAISQLKEQFQECVNISLAKHGKSRIIIFVDDLDRLQPAKAVEVLEVLKLFLDCDHCVFVLAIDYGVVSQGVKQKYGSTIGEEKGRSFFDKIIQVPFKMPVAQYDVSKYVKDILKQMGILCTDEETSSYVSLIQSSIGCNPRSMKRLFNAFLLLIKVAPEQTLASDWNKKVLFAVLCLQLSFENIYNYIVRNRKSINGEFLLSLADKERFETYLDADQLKKELSIDNDNELNRMVHFMKFFNRVVDKDGNMSFSDLEIANFVDVIGFSTITSASEIKSSEENEEILNFRRSNRAIVKRVNTKIMEAHNIEFAVYQSNDDRNDWKFYYASGYKWFWKDMMPYCLDVIITTDLKDKQSNVTMKIGPRKNMTSAQLFDVLREWNGESELAFKRTVSDFQKVIILPNGNYDETCEFIFRQVSPVLDSLKGYYDKL